MTNYCRFCKLKIELDAERWYLTSEAFWEKSYSGFFRCEVSGALHEPMRKSGKFTSLYDKLTK